LVGIRILIDRVIGKASPHSAEDRTQTDIFRRNLMEMLVPRGDLKRITRLFGLHYEFTSMAIRALGGKVGKNIYWPGQGPEIQDFSLITVGNDVVFGSRSFVVTSDSLGSAPVEIQDRAMVGDRVILSPGSTIGKNTLLGSGTLAKRHQTYATDTVWLGNKDGGPVSLTKSSYESEKWTLKDHYGDLEAPKIESRSSLSYSTSQSTLGLIQELETDHLLNESPETELLSTPFGRAFYYHKAPYFVFNQTTIFLYCTTLLILARVFWDNGPLLSIAISMMNKHSTLLNPGPQRPFIIYGYAVALSSVVIPLQCLISMFVTIAAKWALLGRRKPGSYDWDKSSYCQRWQVLLTTETIINETLDGIGVLRMLSGTHYAVLYFRALGAKIGKDCALYAGGELSVIITEPDLLELGDRVAIDDASLVSHLNSRGYFSLNRLSVGSRSVLRSGSRLLSGAEMGEDTCLLEHTLIMGGDTADDGKTYQGWPADVFKGARMKLGA
jgi:acetyltransferase-like isoleucine patch superfamily enzyme